MKKLYLIICTVILFLWGCKYQDLIESNEPVYVDNKSKDPISFYIPLIGMEGVVYPDTTLSINKKNIGYTTKPGKRAYAGISNISIENWLYSFPNDTVSIFIFNQDTLDTYSWEIIQKDYKIVKRYDLSLGDFQQLKNEDDIPVITYPPTEKMKEMKMYPPYD